MRPFLDLRIEEVSFEGLGEEAGTGGRDWWNSASWLEYLEGDLHSNPLIAYPPLARRRYTP